MTRFLVVLACFALVGCGADLCSNDSISRIASPDGKWEAVVFTRACGATTADSRQVSIVRPGVDIKEAGNTFVTDQRTGITARWLSPSQLVISSDPDAAHFKNVTTLNGITVTYEALN